MPEPLQYSEAMGSPEAHLSVMKNRVDSAQAAYDRAVQKGFAPQIAKTKEHLDEARQHYERFMSGALGQDKPQPETKAASAVN